MATAEELLESRPQRPYQEPHRPMRGALHQMIRAGDLSGVEAVLRKYPQAVNQLAPFFISPLHEACRSGQQPVVEFLLSQGADVHARDQWNRTPIWIASWWGRCDLIELLLDAGAGSDLAFSDIKGRSAVDVAATATRCPAGARDAVLAVLSAGPKLPTAEQSLLDEEPQGHTEGEETEGTGAKEHSDDLD